MCHKSEIPQQFIVYAAPKIA